MEKITSVQILALPLSLRVSLANDSYFDLSIFLYEVGVLNINLDCCVKNRFNAWFSVGTILSLREDLMMFGHVFRGHYGG